MAKRIQPPKREPGRLKNRPVGAYDNTHQQREPYQWFASYQRTATFRNPKRGLAMSVATQKRTSSTSPVVPWCAGGPVTTV